MPKTMIGISFQIADFKHFKALHFAHFVAIDALLRSSG